MNLQTKLIAQQLMFDFLMYGIILIGGLSTIGLYIIASVWKPDAHWYVPYISIGTFFGAALCRYFIHSNGEYLAKKGSGDLKQYEKDRKNNTTIGSFVAFMNFGFVGLIVLTTFGSLGFIRDNGTWIQVAVRAMYFLLAVGSFALAPAYAKRGWSKLKASNKLLD